MNQMDQLQAIDQATLTPVVRQALGSDSVTLVDWQVAPHRGGAGQCVYRFAGSAQDQGQTVPWSLILKVARAPDGEAEPSAHRYWKREMLAYQSGLLADLPAGLQAPRCFGVAEQPGGGGWLWLEEITDAAVGRWPRERFTTVARHLGIFSGTYLTDRPLPAYPWLSRGWFRSHVASVAPAIDVLPELLEHPLLRPALPTATAARILRVWHEREAFFDALDRLPQTFCHLDAFPRNVFVRNEGSGEVQIVAIDWEFVGVSAVGAELGQLMAGTLLFEEADLDTAAELEEAVFASYLKGLDVAAWRGDPRLVRLGYATTLMLHQVFLLVGGVVEGTWNEGFRHYVEVMSGRPYADLLERSAVLFDFLLARADETRELRRSL